MDKKELERYCIKEGIKCIGMATHETDVPRREYFRGKAVAFMWIAACVQNGMRTRTKTTQTAVKNNGKK